MNSTFWESFEKTAKKRKAPGIMDKIRSFLSSRMKGHSIKSLFSTSAGKSVKKL